LLVILFLMLLLLLNLRLGKRFLSRGQELHGFSLLILIPCNVIVQQVEESCQKRSSKWATYIDPYILGIFVSHVRKLSILVSYHIARLCDSKGRIEGCSFFHAHLVAYHKS
jgi:hypothetical protein